MGAFESGDSVDVPPPYAACSPSAPSGGPVSAAKHTPKTAAIANVSVHTPIAMRMVDSLPVCKIHRKGVERWCYARHHQRNQQAVKARHRAPGPVGEQVLDWPWPEDRGKNDAETYRMERESCWLLGPVWAPIPARVGDSRQAG
jgi:hypothetical protein